MAWTSRNKTALQFIRNFYSQRKDQFVSLTRRVFHDPVGRSSERIHNQRKRDDGISSGRGGRKRLAQLRYSESHSGKTKNENIEKCSKRRFVMVGNKKCAKGLG